MSFYESLHNLKTKILLKNIVVCSGNVDEFIPIEFIFSNDKSLNKSENFTKSFIQLKDYLSIIGENFGFKTIKYFSPSTGEEDLLIKETNSIKADDKSNSELETDNLFNFEENNNSNNCKSFVNFVSNVIDKINLSLFNNGKNKSIYIVDCGDILLENQNIDLTKNELGALISSFLNIQESRLIDIENRQCKLVLICRTPQLLNPHLINHVESTSVTIDKPDYLERKDFLKKYIKRFECLSEDVNNFESKEFEESIRLTDNYSFREIIQLLKFSKDYTPYLSDISFTDLYNLVNFKAKKSEWEKIDNKRIEQLKTILNKRVKGQDNAIQLVENTIVRNLVGLNNLLQPKKNNKPKGVLFFVGPTGVGKTEMAKSIAEFIFGDESRLIRFDMSEYNHEHSDQRLIGAPPGYVGYDSGGQLTNAIKEKPFSILLFDEIEKAHPKILDKFLQILDDGRLASSQGEIIDFSQTMIIFTSNLGASEISYKNSADEISKEFIRNVSNYFANELKRPEILNRIGIKNIIPFQFIQDPTDIILSKVDSIIDGLERIKLIKLRISKEIKNKLINFIRKTFNVSFGGRGIVTDLETYFIDYLSKFIFENYNLWKRNFNKNKLTFIECKNLEIISNIEIRYTWEIQ